MTIRGLSAGYGDDAIIRDLDLAVPRGKFTALLGPNGCGKSTLLRTVAGLQKPMRGEIVLGDTPTHQMSSKALARRVSILAQNAQAPDGLTVSDLVRQGRYPHRSLLGGWSAEDSMAVQDALRLTHMTHLQNRLLTQLSGGQRQRAWIAMTLAQKGEILLLDEPTSFLDLGHQLELLSLVRDLIDRREVTVLAVLHDLNQAARYADKLVLLNKGSITAQGNPHEVLTPDRVRSAFGIDVRVIADPETQTPLCIPRRIQPVMEST
ncbi:UNVERIFIED_CONTAM: hypothetical protein GTU68_040747 [Idotea baltica]|nr:hypothetical protein [Idotea baltica]